MASRLTQTGDWFDFTRTVTNALKIGMTSSRVNKIIEEKRPGVFFWSDSFSATNKIGLRRSLMGNGSGLVLGFAGMKDGFNIGEDDKLVFIQTVQFSDLKSEMAEGLFEPLKLIHLSPRVAGYEFDPVPLVRVVNGLHALGNEKALHALREYRKLAGESNGSQDIEIIRRSYHRAWIYDIDDRRLFLIARLLFKRTDGVDQMPLLKLGATSPPGGPDKDWPLFPLVVGDDVPFLMINGYNLAGAAEPSTRHIDYCERNCDLRKSPLLPADSPMRAAERVFASTQWKSLFSGDEDLNGRHAKSLLRAQAIRSVEDLLAPTSNDYMSLEPNCAPATENDRTWQRFLTRFEQLNIKWSVEKNKYVITSQ